VLRALRPAGLLVCALLGVAAGLGVPIALARGYGVEHKALDINILDFMRHQVDRMLERRPSRVPRVYVLGDSTLISYPPGRTVPARLQKELDALGGVKNGVRVHSMAALGMTFFDQYFVADLIAEAPPDLLVINFHLPTISTHRRVDFVRPPLAGALSPRRIPEALGMPLNEFGMTADRMLLYVAIVQLGAFDTWKWLIAEQTRIARGRAELELWLGRRFSPMPRSGAAPEEAWELLLQAARTQGSLEKGGRRYTASGEEHHFGPALQGVSADHETLQAVAKTLAAYRRAGIDVILYVNPTNIDNLKRVGVHDAEGLARTLASLEELAQANGAGFVDLHDLLPDAGFRDAAGHFSTGEIDGPRRVAEALAPMVLEKLQPRPSAPR